MKEVDPEVARLLEDLPRSKLPEALVKEDWGKYSMKDYERVSGKVPKAPSTVHQPVYAHRCYQCARPITIRSSRWVDHAGSSDCDGGAVAEREFPHHVIESEIEFSRDVIARSKERNEERRRVLQARQTAAAAAKDARDKAMAKPCAASRHSHKCQHKCMEKRSDHFGFHHCRYCGHLWG